MKKIRKKSFLCFFFKSENEYLLRKEELLCKKDLIFLEKALFFAPNKMDYVNEFLKQSKIFGRKPD